MDSNSDLELAPLERASKWELLAGGRVMNAVGALALVIGVGFLLKYAFDRNWIDVIVRISGGVAFGAAMLGAGELLRRRAVSDWFIGGIVGAGLGILYLSGYAAFEVYHLVPFGVAFAFMAAVTAAAFALAKRYDIFAVAIIGWFGGFATPFFMGDLVANELGLGAYLLFLDAGMLALVLTRPGWFALQPLAMVASHVAATAWYARFGASGSAAISTIVLLSLLALFFAASFVRARRTSAGTFDAFGIFDIVNSLALWCELALLPAHGIDALTFGIAAAYFAAYLALQPEGAAPVVQRLQFFATAVVLLGAWSFYRGDHPYVGATVLAAIGAGLPLVAIALRRLDRPFAAADVTLAVLPLFATSFAISLFQIAGNWFAASYGVHREGGFAFEFGGRDLALVVLTVALAAVERANAAGLLDGRAWQRAALRIGGFAAAAAFVAVHTGAFVRADALAGLALLAVACGVRFMFRDLENAGLAFFGLAAVAALTADNAAYAPTIAAHMPLAGSRLVAVGVLGACALSAAEIFRRRRLLAGVDRLLTWLGAAVLIVGASLEIRDAATFWTLNASYTLTEAARLLASARIANVAQLALSGLWLAASFALVGIGIKAIRRDLRLMGLGLFALTIGKAFFIDLAGLATPYRIAAFIGLGLVLLAASYLYQRFEKSLGTGLRAGGADSDAGSAATNLALHIRAYGAGAGK
ncbi:MAG: DUF2339 domain-containing protein [Candidatus Eremiobacteraeota bacterium]|nr:DUF2339 domain-containing protein [Candidatus Eremiobacteraeota bacterium]